MYDNDDSGCAGCLTLLIVAAIFTWLSDNWQTILIVILAIIAIGAIIAGLSSYNAKAPERAAAAKAKAEKEAKDKIAKEEASYRAYVHSYEGNTILSNKLYTANAIINKLHEETDESKRVKILAFFDRYLPVITEIIEASKHGEVEIDDSVNRFTDAVKAFSKSLYKVDDVVDVNSAVLENMAIRDGFYDPYAEDLGFNNEQACVEGSVQDRLEEAILLDDFDTIRDMLDSGVISEFDIDDDVLSKVEEY